MTKGSLGPTRRRVVLAAALALGLGAMPPTGFAGASSPGIALVEGMVDQAWRILAADELSSEQRLDQLALLFSQRTDMDLLSRLALGRHWTRLSPTQQERYSELFRRVIVRRLAERLELYARDAVGPVEDHFQLLGEQAAGRADTLVRSRVLPKGGAPLSVDWRVRMVDNQPVIIDLIIEGVSLLISQRSEFAAVIERRNVDGLLTELEARAGGFGS